MKKRIFVLLVALVLMFGCVVGGTVAWLVTRTEPLLNTFAPSTIDITLHESVINPETGKPTGGITYDGNSGIKLVPGRTITKDPTITVKGGSEDCYVRMYVVLQWPAAADSKFTSGSSGNWIDLSGNGWSVIPRFQDNYSFVGQDIYEFRYPTAITSSAQDQTVPIAFGSVTLPIDLSSEQISSLQGAEIRVYAQAVQAQGFASAEEAFAEAGDPTDIADLLAYLWGEVEKQNAQNSGS